MARIPQALSAQHSGEGTAYGATYAKWPSVTLTAARTAVGQPIRWLS